MPERKYRRLQASPVRTKKLRDNDIPSPMQATNKEDRQCIVYPYRYDIMIMSTAVHIPLPIRNSSRFRRHDRTLSHLQSSSRQEARAPAKRLLHWNLSLPLFLRAGVDSQHHHVGQEIRGP